ncbi:Fic family protein [Patescibacteria group bacterium]|nr:Fic family protein [Patescibacteria group bacterium]
MILFELVGNEEHKAYQDLSIDNLERQYFFLRSIINAAVALQRPMISTAIITALNFHAISCLHVNAGQYRPCPVTVGGYTPPDYYRVPELMNAFVNEVNHAWEQSDAVALATDVLWKLNFIHPFINGNGRTARALCYFVVCVKSGGLLKGDTALPDLIRANRAEYVTLLKEADKGHKDGVPDYLRGLHGFLVRLVEQQLQSAT